MKKIVGLILAVAIMLFCAPMALAAGPDDGSIDVGITVVTPGDANVNVGIDAGGNVNLNVGGIDLNGLNNQVNKLSENDGSGSINTADWYRYFSKEMTPYTNFISGLGNTVSLLTEAEAKLISGQELSQAEIANIGILINELKTQDDKTWNQLMNGAEYHLSLMDTTVATQEAQIENLQAQLDTAQANNTDLRNYTDYLQRQYLYYFWILGGACLVLFVMSMVLFFRRQR